MTSAAQDQRYLRLRRYTRRLFPELVCPVHDEIGTPAASGKPSENVWCHGKGADNGHWFTKAERGHQWRLELGAELLLIVAVFVIASALWLWFVAAVLA